MLTQPPGNITRSVATVLQRGGDTMSVESIKAQLTEIFAEARLRRPTAESRREAKLGRLRGLIAEHRMASHFEPYLKETFGTTDPGNLGAADLDRALRFAERLARIDAAAEGPALVVRLPGRR